MSRGQILVVDDEEDMLEAYDDILSYRGFSVTTCSSGSSALELLGKKHFDLMLIDLIMPEMNGVEVLRQAEELQPETVKVIVTGYPTIETAVEAIKAGAFDYLVKPFSDELLKINVERALEWKAMEGENQFLVHSLNRPGELEGFIGTDPEIKRVLGVVAKVADSDSSVLITGESGTGKELIARLIHAQSHRVDKPFLPVNCGAMPESLIESELFGHERGAFTGASHSRPGLLEHASGGTFFLDEIGDLPLHLQVKLLRVLEENKVRRVGGGHFVEIDVRFIASTNRPIEEEVAQGRFREDLYYRLNVVRINLPPLRARPRDIPLLALHFLEELNARPGRAKKKITDEALKRLEAYRWPGNIRQLRNLIETVYLLVEGPLIEETDLPEPFRNESGAVTVSPSRLSFQEAKQAAIDQFERRYFRDLMARHRGNVTRAAQESGIHRTAFHRLLKKHQISSAEFRIT